MIEGGDAFVEPGGVPPGGRHQVAQPLVHDLVADDVSDGLSLRPRRHALLPQQEVFPEIHIVASS